MMRSIWETSMPWRRAYHRRCRWAVAVITVVPAAPARTPRAIGTATRAARLLRRVGMSVSMPDPAGAPSVRTTSHPSGRSTNRVADATLCDGIGAGTCEVLRAPGAGPPRVGREGVAKTTVDEQGTAAHAARESQAEQDAAAAGANPALVGVPTFVIGSVALGLYLVGFSGS